MTEIRVQKPKIEALGLEGVYLIRSFVKPDERGVFYKTFTTELLAKIGATGLIAEEFLSTNHIGALRGLHYQRGEASQAKLITCIRGKIFDVIVDLRKSSPTYGQHITLELNGNTMDTLFVPHGFAHGFLTLVDDSCVAYRADRPYSPSDECGIVYSDHQLKIAWPKIGKILITPKDAAWPTFEMAEKFE